MDKQQLTRPELPRRKKLRATTAYGYTSERQETDAVPASEREGDSGGGDEEDGDEEDDEEEEGQEGEDSRATADRADSLTSQGAVRRHTKLMDLEQLVRNLERDNLHLKQALLQGTSGAGSRAAARLSSVAGARPTATPAFPAATRATVKGQRLLAERTKVVTEMVKQLNAAYLSLSDASRVWHKDCRIGVGVHEWDAIGRLETISLWNMIRSVFTNVAVDIVELRPHVADGEMMLTKWRIQGEVASAQSLETVCASEDCPATMRVALLAIKSSDLTFTVTTYVVFDDLHIAEQYHSWDQVGVFKRLFGGEIPLTVHKMLVIDADTVAGRKQPLDV